MRTITIDIINNKAIKLLKELEVLQLIRVRKDNGNLHPAVDWVAKYKGAMTGQSVNDIDNQLNELRNAWE